MKIVVPMAGMGKRMRPHTLVTPKPLLPIAGKPIVQRLVEDITAVCDQEVDEIAFIIGPQFGEEVETNLKQIASDLGAKGIICYQHEPLGTAHAILCAKDQLDGPVIVAFADTLFKADFSLDMEKDGVLWVKQIDDPSAFGVVKVDEAGVITDYVEKPEDFVSDLAMIGIYFFKQGEVLRSELEYLIDNNIMVGGEYQLPDALRNMTSKGAQFTPGKVDAWLDCGNKNATVDTNAQVLEFKKGEQLIDKSAQIINSVVIPPCYIGKEVSIKNSVIGPHVSVHANSELEGVIMDNGIVYSNTKIQHKSFTNSMIGNHVSLAGKPAEVSVGDYTSES